MSRLCSKPPSYLLASLSSHCCCTNSLRLYSTVALGDCCSAGPKQGKTGIPSDGHLDPSCSQELFIPTNTEASVALSLRALELSAGLANFVKARHWAGLQRGGSGYSAAWIWRGQCSTEGRGNSKVDRCCFPGPEGQMPPQASMLRSLPQGHTEPVSQR